jgi:hypothetical protein
MIRNYRLNSFFYVLFLFNCYFSPLIAEYHSQIGVYQDIYLNENIFFNKKMGFLWTLEPMMALA